MKYETRDQTFMIRKITEDELAADAARIAALTPAEREECAAYEREFGALEFYVKVSQVSRGWWTRKEVTALRDKLNEALGG